MVRRPSLRYWNHYLSAFAKTLLQNTPIKIGYARISTDEQSLDLQHDALRKAGCEEMFEDCGVSGVAVQRPGLEAALLRSRVATFWSRYFLSRFTRRRQEGNLAPHNLRSNLCHNSLFLKAWMIAAAPRSHAAIANNRLETADNPAIAGGNQSMGNM
jgi:hypothetical protein